MNESDQFALLLFEEAKRFLEKSYEEKNAPDKVAYCHAALLLGYGALEAHINCISEDFIGRSDLSVLDNSILQERDFELDKGEFSLTTHKKIFRLEERIEYLHRRFSGSGIDKNSSWWGQFKRGLQLRNSLTHPKGNAAEINEAAVGDILKAVIELIDTMYQAIYKKSYPWKRQGLDSKLNF